ncbi:MAG: O-antigen ligase family protein [Parcubacteria group bacterium]
MLNRLITASLYLLVFLLPFQTRWIYSAAFLNGQYFEYGTFCLYATELLLGAIMIMAIIYASIRMWLYANDTNMRMRKVMPFIIALLILILNCALAINPQLAFYKLSWLIQAAAIFFIILLIKPDHKKIAWAIIASATAQSLFAIQQFFSQQVVANKWLGIASQLPATLGVPVVEANGIRWLRTFGTLPHPNMLAGFLAIGLLLIVLLAMDAPRRTRFILSGLFIVTFFALLTALSRGALLAFFIALAVLIVVSSKKNLQTASALSFTCLALIMLAIFSFAYPQLIKTRALGNDRIENISNTTRVEQYSEFRDIYKNNWILGVGLGNYPVALHQLKPNEPAYSLQPIHNTFLLIIAELGLFGILALALLGALLITPLFRVGMPALPPSLNNFGEPRKGGVSPNSLTLPTLLTLLTFLALIDHYFWSFYFGIMLATIILALPFIPTRQTE